MIIIFVTWNRILVWTFGAKLADILCGPKCERGCVILTFSTTPSVFQHFRLVLLKVFFLVGNPLPLVMQTARLLPLSVFSGEKKRVDMCVDFVPGLAASDSAVLLHVVFPNFHTFFSAPTLWQFTKISRQFPGSGPKTSLKFLGLWLDSPSV